MLVHVVQQFEDKFKKADVEIAPVKAEKKADDTVDVSVTVAQWWGALVTEEATSEDGFVNWRYREIAAAVNLHFMKQIRDSYSGDSIIQIVESTVPEHRDGETGKFVRAKDIFKLKLSHDKSIDSDTFGPMLS